MSAYHLINPVGELLPGNLWSDMIFVLWTMQL